jgi:hypothetical protein
MPKISASADSHSKFAIRSFLVRRTNPEQRCLRNHQTAAHGLRRLPPNNGQTTKSPAVSGKHRTESLIEADLRWHVDCLPKVSQRRLRFAGCRSRLSAEMRGQLELYHWPAGAVLVHPATGHSRCPLRPSRPDRCSRTNVPGSRREKATAPITPASKGKFDVLSRAF